MAKRRSSGGVKAERFVNRYRGEITSLADATTVVAVTVNTGMNVGRASAFKWVLLAAELMPKHDSFPIVVGASAEQQGLKAQLCIGTQTAFLDGDDMQVVCEAARGGYMYTSGGMDQPWPLMFDVAYPLPVFAQTLTMLLKSGVDHAGLDSVTYTFTLWYVMQGINEGEIVEYLAAFGQV